MGYSSLGLRSVFEALGAWLMYTQILISDCENSPERKFTNFLLTARRVLLHFERSLQQISMVVKRSIDQAHAW